MSVDGAALGHELREEHGSPKATLIILRMYLGAFLEADSWGQRALLLLWTLIYGAVAVLAIVIWALVLPFRLLAAGGRRLRDALPNWN